MDLWLNDQVQKHLSTTLKIFNNNGDEQIATSDKCFNIITKNAKCVTIVSKCVASKQPIFKYSKYQPLKWMLIQQY